MADTFKGIITADGKKRQLPYESVLETPVSDETLSIQGGFADAKVVGNNFKKAKAETDSLKEDLSAITDTETKTETHNIEQNVIKISGASWYDGMLNGDKVHPTELGAKTLYMRALADVPELMCN